MAIETVLRDDVRFAVMNRGKNPRFPPSPADAASRIALCDSTADVAEALERFVHAGLRPTVRSGGHCYENFVYTNPQGAVIDLSMMADTTPEANGSKYRVAAGTQLGQAYTELYKRAQVTIPGGSCVTVGAGGHFPGGGYGLLSRLHGLTSDWVTAVDIVTVDQAGKAMARRVDRNRDADLFRACRGAGGGSFGIITNFYFDKLPMAPVEVMKGNLSFGWDGMTEERFGRILSLYSNYWATRGKDPDTWGLFTVFGLSHRSSGHLGMSVQFCNPDGTCNDLKPLEEFFALFEECKPVTSGAVKAPQAMDDHAPQSTNAGDDVCLLAKHTVTKRNWLEANVTGGGSGVEQRRKHKSTYMKGSFTKYETACIYKYLNMAMPGVDLSRETVLADSFGGAANRKELIEETSVVQRASTLKLQFIASWMTPDQDAGNLKWLKDFYTELYSGPDTDERYKGTPYHGDRYEGCYINYPDIDMLAYDFWPQLYYGDQGMYPFLQSVKRKYDPNNIFHHAMSVRA